MGLQRVRHNWATFTSSCLAPITMPSWTPCWFTVSHLRTEFHFLDFHVNIIIEYALLYACTICSIQFFEIHACCSSISSSFILCQIESYGMGTPQFIFQLYWGVIDVSNYKIFKAYIVAIWLMYMPSLYLCTFIMDMDVIFMFWLR